MNKAFLPGVFTMGVLSVAAPALAEPTLERVKIRSVITSSTSQGVPGFFLLATSDECEGFDIKICRSLSEVVLNYPDKVKLVTLSSKHSLTALQTGKINVLLRQATWALGRDTRQGENFNAGNSYDCQGFTLRENLNLLGINEREGASICVSQDTTSELNLAEHSGAHSMKYEAVAYGASEDASTTYTSVRCNALTNDISVVASYRSKLKDADQHAILSEIISNEPVGPCVRRSDDQWFDLVRRTVIALVNAEELGVAEANAEELKRNLPALKSDGFSASRASLAEAWA